MGKAAEKAPAQPWRLFICCITLQLSILILLGPISHDLLAIQLTADPSAFRAIVGKWDASDLANFVWHFALDAPYPLFYGALLWKRATYLLGNHRTDRARLLLRLLRGSAAVGAVCDVAENFLHMYALNSTDFDLESTSDWIIRTAAISAMIKWVLLLPTVCALAPGAPILCLAGPVAPVSRSGLRRPYASSLSS